MRLIAAIPEPAVIRRLLTPLKLAALPPLIAPARLVQEHFAWVSAYITDGDGRFGPQQGRGVSARPNTRLPLTVRVMARGRWGRL